PIPEFKYACLAVPQASWLDRSYPNIPARRRLQGLVTGLARAGRCLAQASALLCQPLRPGPPPAAGCFRGGIQPCLSVGGRFAGWKIVCHRPIVTTFLGRRINDACNVTRRAQHESPRTNEEVAGRVSRFPRDDMIFARSEHIGRYVERAEINSLAVDLHPARFTEIVL